MFNFETKESVNDLTFYNPSKVGKSCDDCDFKTYEESDLEKHVKISQDKKSNNEANFKTTESEDMRIVASTASMLEEPYWRIEEPNPLIDE